MLSIHFCLVASKLGRASGLLHRAEDFAYMQALQEKSAAVKDAEALQVCGPQGSPATQRFCSMRGRGFGVESCCVLFPSGSSSTQANIYSGKGVGGELMHAWMHFKHTQARSDFLQ